MKKTSNGSMGVSFWLALNPVPCPRPRIRVMTLRDGKRMGVAYYTGNYKVFMADAPIAIPESSHFFAKGSPVEVNIAFFMRSPKKPANSYPVGDIDNYVKSVLDAITKNGTYWHDDAQVISLHATKQYGMVEEETPGIWVEIKEPRL